MATWYVLQRDAVVARDVATVCYKETQWWAGRRKQELEQDIIKAHAQARNVSPPTQANTTTQRQSAQHTYTSHNQQPAFQGAARVSDQDTSHESLHNTCHQGGANRQAKPGPKRGQSTNRPQVRADRKFRRWRTR